MFTLRKIGRWLMIAAGAIAFAILAYTYGPLLRKGPDQDHCSFGSVTNDQYRTYLSEARRRQSTVWPRFTNDQKEISSLLNARVREMIGDDRSIYKRLAIVHAVLRAIGAQYLNTGGVARFDPFSTDKPLQMASLSYLVDINRLVWFRPYPKDLWISAHIFDPSGRLPEVRRQHGALELNALMTGLFNSPAAGFLVSDETNCPPVPSAETAARYEARRRGTEFDDLASAYERRL